MTEIEAKAKTDRLNLFFKKSGAPWKARTIVLTDKRCEPDEAGKKIFDEKKWLVVID